MGRDGVELLQPRPPSAPQYSLPGLARSLQEAHGALQLELSAKTALWALLTLDPASVVRSPSDFM